MVFLDRFRKIKKEKGRWKEKKREWKEVRVKREVKEGAKKAPIEKPISRPSTKLKKGDVLVAPRVLKSPQITEKATFLQNQNQYVFKVFPRATKPEVKKSIEEVYGVNVSQVRIVQVPRKRKRLGRSTGWQSGYKKAIVKIKPGENIEILPR